MTYTEIQVKGKSKYYYRAKSIRDGSRFKKLRKYMGVDLGKEELENKEKEMDILLGESFKGVLRDEGIGKMRQRLIVDVSRINTTENPIKISDLKINQPSLNKVKNISEQYNKAFHSKVFTLMASSESELYTFAKRSPQHYKTCFCFIKEEEGQWYLGSKDLEYVRAWILKEARKSPQPIFELYNRWERDWQKYLRLEKELRKINFSTLTTKELYKQFKEFYQQYQLIGSIAYICDAFMSYGEKDWLEQLIIEELRKLGKPMPECIKLVRKLTCPIHLSFSLEEEYQLMKIAEKFLEKLNNIPKSDKIENIPSLEIIRNEHLALYKELKDHEETFYWINNNYFNVHYMNVEEFYNKIIDMIKEFGKDANTLKKVITEKEKQLKEIREEREQLINELSMSRFIKNILKIARLFSKWKDIRKSGVYIGMYHFDGFLDEVAKRTEFTKKQLTFCIFQEMEDILFGINHENIRKEIKERQKQCFFAFSDHGYYITGGKKAEKYFKLLNKHQDKSILEIKGVVASPGKARGRVRIVSKTQDIKDFKTGEILVANQTTPDYLPALKKAAAIVTEQGGITSHAAIVSRELKKPCIIGTRNATTALSDGEMVIVDADKGVVKRET